MASHINTEAGLNQTPIHQYYMQRCLALAVLGAGFTAPNPLVGAVLVYGNRIIGEGYHEKYGAPHAEVNCIHSVKTADQKFISSSTLYVSLEPCCHFGKTPPCTDLIIQEKIPRVVIGCRDPFPAVDGKGIEKLRSAGIEVDFPVMEIQAREMNRRFFSFHLKKRPYVILKWAQSANLKMSGKTGPTKISNVYSDRLVHRWRSEEAGILIGANTALKDNPELNTRLWVGKNPIRIVLDSQLRLPDSLKIFDGSVPTIILNSISDLKAGARLFKKINENHFDIQSILNGLHSLNVLSIMVEGGPHVLQQFIDSKLWDEMRIITNHALEIEEGKSSPEKKRAGLIRTEMLGSDSIGYYNQRDITES